MNAHLSEIAKVTVLETVDIGGTNAAAVGGNWDLWLDMRDFDRVTALLEIGTWDAGDDLDVCKLQQAQDVNGTGAKDLTTSASGGDYDSDAPVDADGDQVILEARADQLDVENGFHFVRAYASEAGNTGVDNISGVIVRHAAHRGFANQHATPVAASVVYVRP